MKKIITVLLLLVAIVYLLVFYLYSKTVNSKNSKKVEVPSFTPTTSQKKKLVPTSFIFIPYWDIPRAPTDIFSYDEIIYFGVTPGASGVSKTDEGYRNLDEFNAVTTGRSHKTLTLRMTDADQTLSILKNEKSQRDITSDLITIASENGFRNILLDLELSGLYNEDTIGQINSFVQYLYTETKKNNIGLYMAVYGDTFYRKRPFNIQTLSTFVDGFYIMAYDLHKSIGEPGPNFPLRGKEKFGYDFETMTDDFLRYVPVEKLSVIFGMYGYDWIVDEKKRPIKPAKAISLTDITASFVDNCPWKNCTNLQDSRAKESEINYIDQYLNYHIIWYETEASVQAKKEFLKKKGIGNTGFWVYGYF